MALAHSLHQVEPIMQLLLDNWKLLVLGSSLGYLALCSLLRHQRLRQMHREYNYTTRKSFSSMTVEDAWAIQRYLFELEFPRIFSGSVFFAIFKTYGIPSSSKLLLATGQLSSHKNVSKRSADTGALLVEAVVNPPNSDRSLSAISRINYMHEPYRRGGKISDEDMLYTLSLFALEPMRWTNRIEWRKLSDMEMCAVGTYWRCMGDALGVPYYLLPSSSSNNNKGKDNGGSVDGLQEGSWKDGLEWLMKLDEWSQRYEEEFMVPDLSNRKLAEYTVNYLVELVPAPLKTTITNMIMVLIGERLREAIMYDKPPAFYYTLVSTILSIRRVYLRYFCLPRSENNKETFLPKEADPITGRYHNVKWVIHPWYAPPTFINRWHPKSWIAWMLGGVLPGDKDAEKYHPEGYTFLEIGPEGIKSRGMEKMEEMKEGIVRRRLMGGCPFVGKE